MAMGSVEEHEVMDENRVVVNFVTVKRRYSKMM